MKKYFYSAVVALMALFTASCSQEENFDQNNVAPVAPVSVSFKVDVPTEGIITRAADDGVKRYAIAIENVDDPSNPWTVDLIGEGDDSKKMLIQAGSEFTIDDLTDGSKYVAYFWADYDTVADGWTGGAYDISWFNWIKVNWNEAAGSYAAGMAYCGSLAFTAGETADALSVTLKRVVAKVNLVQSGAGTSNGETLQASYRSHGVYNIKTKSTIEDDTDPDTEGVQDYQFTYSKTIEAGAVADGDELNSFYVLTSDEGATIDIYMTKDNWTTNLVEGGVTNVPVKANYQTNIKGAYFTNGVPGQVKFTVTTDAAWGEPASEKTFGE
jgi:hypothetical protein